MEKISFVNYTEEYLDLSWDWLNDPEIKKLTNTPDFTKEIQRKWFDKLKENSNYKVWGIECGNDKIGVAGLKNIENKCAEYFGYIGVKAYWNKGLSNQILSQIVVLAKEGDINKLWLRVTENNQRAISAYTKFGFEKFEQIDNEILMRFHII